MSREKEQNNPVNPLAKWILGFVLVLGMVLILSDLSINAPVQTKTERPAKHQEIPKQTTAPALEISEETILMQTEPEPIPQETRPPTQETAVPIREHGSAGPVEYEMSCLDRSYVNQDGKKQMTYYYDYPVIHSEEEAHERINAAVYRAADSFMNEMTQEQIEKPVMSVFGTPVDGIYTMETEVCHNADGVFSLLHTSHYDMGGNHSIKNWHGVTYSLLTGEVLTLTQLTDLEESALLKELQTRAYTGLEASAGPMLIADAREVLSRYALEDFDFLIQEGEIVLLFKSYAFTAGAAGPQSIGTGLYITYP